MFRFLLFLGSLIFIMLYYSSYIDIFAEWIRTNGLFISVIIFMGTLIYSWIKKKPKYSHSIIQNLEKPMNFNLSRPTNNKDKATTTTPRSVSNLTKKITASNQNWQCGDCQVLLDYTYEVDHKIPLFKGGNNDPTNLIALCRNCHGKKTILEKLKT